jgi:hypothetical protein
MIKAKADIKHQLPVLVSLLSILSYIIIPTVRATTELTITENGSGSGSEVQVTSITQTDVTQTNTGEFSNTVNTTSNTGDNSASGNTNGDTTITTGDSNTQVAIENSGNISSAETECCSDGTTAQITGNGSDSNNQINVSNTSATNISVYQNATVKNNIYGYANTGNNSTNYNTGGDSLIVTGDIKVSGRITNGPINLSSVKVTEGLSKYAGKIVGNGYKSENNVEAVFNKNTNVYTYFNADLENSASWDLNTGRNKADYNTDGDVTIKTGDITLDFFITNFVNLSKVKVTCCLPEKEDGKEDPKEEQKPKEENGKGGDGGGGGGQILPEAAAVEAGGPGIDGLAVTSGNSLQAYLFLLGLAAISLGGKMATNELWKDYSKKKR